MKKLQAEIRKYPFVYILLVIILAVGLFFRVYRTDQILGFYFDQGRDALVIWNFWHKGDIFLVGPTTGIEGILRGPWYYWLIAPFYLLGGGDPVWPAVFLAFLTIVANLFVFIIVKKIAGHWAGVFAVTIASISYYLVLASRWLSNPTPMLLISTLLVLGMYLAMEGKKWAWVLIGAVLGMAMQFGSAAEVFYFPAVLLFAFWQRKNLPSKKIIFLSLLMILFAFVPQIIFDFIHNGVLSTAIKKFIFEKESFKLSFWEIIQARLPFYEDVFSSKIFPSARLPWKIFGFIAFASLLFNFKLLWNKKHFKFLLILLVSPLVGMLFFQGNYGNVYDYYFTGYYLIFIIIFSILIYIFLSGPLRWILIGIFLFVFLNQNLVLDKNYVVAGVDGPNNIKLGNQVQSVNWVFDNAEKRIKEFNVDVYVPPVIPYAYDYLFLWQATRRCGNNLCGLVLDKQVPNLYTLFEVDPPHPERLDAWLARQKGIGRVEETELFGGITIERRIRIK